MSEIDSYRTVSRQGVVWKAVHSLTEEQQDMFWAAIGQDDPSLRRPFAAVARWLTAQSGIRVTGDTLIKWTARNV